MTATVSSALSMSQFTSSLIHGRQSRFLGSDVEQKRSAFS
jgi:hypothetical protein